MNQPMTLNPQNLKPASRWPAHLTLGFVHHPARGVLLNQYEHQGPLYVQKPFYPEGRQLAHVYLLHPPGGLVSGDDLQVQANVTENAQVLITTPGAGRVYRARPDRTLQQQVNQLNVADGGSLEWLPLENILFPDAQAKLTTRVELTGSAKFIGWEITSLGLPANDTAFDSGSVHQTLQINRDNKIQIRESLLLNDDSRTLFQSAAGLANYPINSLMVAGPFDDVTSENQDALVQRLRELVETRDAEKSYSVPGGKTNSSLTGITMTGDFLILRNLNHCSEHSRKLFSQCWKLIRPELLQRVASFPRIWNT